MRVSCTQCGATLEVAPDIRLMECEYCSTALVIDGSSSLFHQIMLPTIASDNVGAHLRRFLAGTQTVANLDQNAKLGEPTLEYFPFWAFTTGSGREEQIVLEPALPSALVGLQAINLPAGEVQPASQHPSDSAPLLEPEIPRDTALEWLRNKKGEVKISTTVLYHLPLFKIRYSYKGKTYLSAVDGISGKVFPADFPTKAETPFALVAILAIVVFGIEGLLFSNIFVKLFAYLISAPPILMIAWLTSKKV